VGEWEREVFIDLELDVRIRYCRSESPPPIRYAIMLEVLIEGHWTTIRLWDNADALDEHHEHEYTRVEGKQAPTVLPFGSVNDAMAAAIRKARAEWPAFLRRWRGET
jgi:hypothetical protein